MDIGMNVPVMVPGLDRDRILAWCRGIDEGPYSSLAVGERINFPNPAAMVILSAPPASRLPLVAYSSASRSWRSDWEPRYWHSLWPAPGFMHPALLLSSSRRLD